MMMDVLHARQRTPRPLAVTLCANLRGQGGPRCPSPRPGLASGSPWPLNALQPPRRTPAASTSWTRPVFLSSEG